METWIKIDELRTIVDSLNSEKITFGKAIELITEYCRSRVEPSKLSQHDVIKKEVAVCEHEPISHGRMIQCKNCKEILSNF